ncbi:MAG TPA: fluoride efflux transporter CrcB [Edaphocola sp.]|nr:fluoride efflux transporter CrcB [Edaphocola sp.]
MLKSIILVGLGGALGSISRFLLSEYIFLYKKNLLPLATFTINIMGSFLIGLMLAYLLKTSGNQSLKLFLTVGFCGGFTTFSTFALENLKLIQSGQYGLALVYILLSVVLSVLFVAIGFKLMA